jgi:hypothetical protein
VYIQVSQLKNKVNSVIIGVINYYLKYRSSPAPFSLLSNGIREPGESFYQAVSVHGTRPLYKPLPLPELGQLQFVRHLCGRCCSWQVLLVCQHKEGAVPEAVVAEDGEELIACLLEAKTVRGVDSKNDDVVVLKVVLPQRPN